MQLLFMTFCPINVTLPQLSAESESCKCDRRECGFIQKLSGQKIMPLVHLIVFTLPLTKTTHITYDRRKFFGYFLPPPPLSLSQSRNLSVL